MTVEATKGAETGNECHATSLVHFFPPSIPARGPCRPPEASERPAREGPGVRRVKRDNERSEPVATPCEPRPASLTPIPSAAQPGPKDPPPLRGVADGSGEPRDEAWLGGGGHVASGEPVAGLFPYRYHHASSREIERRSERHETRRAPTHYTSPTSYHPPSLSLPHSSRRRRRPAGVRET